jgi:hypothetical protein
MSFFPGTIQAFQLEVPQQAAIYLFSFTDYRSKSGDQLKNPPYSLGSPEETV